MWQWHSWPGVCRSHPEQLAQWRLCFYNLASFEDLARKFLGNNMAIFFAKDALLLIVYLSFFIAYRRKDVDKFQIPFRVPLLLFFWLGNAGFQPGLHEYFLWIAGDEAIFLLCAADFRWLCFFANREGSTAIFLCEYVIVW